MTRLISLSDTRRIADATPGLRDRMLALIAAAEVLRDLHDAECGCDRPGNGAACCWPAADGALLASFDFDEETA